jgi:predicted DNA-binding protein (MmcQ/YjbR family)
MPVSPLARLRKICLALPEAHEVEAWGEPTFRVKNKLFAMYAHSENHHGGGTPSVWLKSTSTNQSFMVAANPKRFFVPPYVGPSGWVGVRLDGRVSWTEVAELCRDAHELLAPKLAAVTVSKPRSRKPPRSMPARVTRASRRPTSRGRAARKRA